MTCWIVLLWLEGSVPAVDPAQDGESSKVVPVGVPGTAFADSELRLQFVCHGRSGVPWQASAARRPFASGVVAPKDDRLEIRLHMPEVKEGVVLPIRVAVGGAVCKILVFGKGPLAGRRQWAEQLQIVLFDPPGKTAQAFDEIGLPFRQLTGLGAMATTTHGMLVVGEGLALAEHPGLDGVVCQVAGRGVPVILLAPESGEFTISDPAPLRFEMRGGPVAQQIDGQTAGDLHRACGYRISGGKNGPLLRVTDNPSDFAWGDFRYGNDRGRLCCLGWHLLDRWETSPAPRFFFVRLLEIVYGGKDLPGGKESD